MYRFISLVLFLFSLTIVIGQNTQSAHKISKTYIDKVLVEYQYLLHLPEDHQHAIDGKLPLIVFLHGAGERGDDIDLLKVHGPPKLVEMGEDLPFIVLSPQCPKNERWKARNLKFLIDDIVKNHPVDASRIYLTGLSMGGFGTWDLAITYPDKFAAIAPICGGSDVNAWDAPRTIKDMPIWAFHGEKDMVVPVENTTRIINSLKNAGAKPKLTLYPEAGHDSWTETYDNPELYEWFLLHKSDK